MGASNAAALSRGDNQGVTECVNLAVLFSVGEDDEEEENWEKQEYWERIDFEYEEVLDAKT